MAESPVEKHPHIPGRKILDRLVLGGSDGVIEGIATTAALNGAGVDFRTILIAGLAFAVAGGLSMFFSNYLARKSELDSLRIDMQRERMEIETEPEEEKMELEGLLRKEGYGQREVDVIMSRLVKDKEMWLRAQLRHELHLDADEQPGDALSRSAPAGLAFFFLAMLALVPYLFDLSHLAALLLSACLSLSALFVLGSKAYTLRHFSLRRGLESAAVGCAAAVILYGAGTLISSL